MIPTRRAILGASASAIALSTAWAGLIPGDGGFSTATISVTPSISGASVDPTSAPEGPDGTVVGAIDVDITNADFTGTLALSGTDASHFRLSSTTLPSNLLFNGSVSAGIYSINIIPTQGGAINSGTPYPQEITVFVPGVGPTITYGNTSGSASPAVTTLVVPQAFARNVVGTGFIAVPQIAGVDATYQADNRKYWDNGTLKFAVFRLTTSAFSGLGSKQIVFDIRTGSYTNTSSITTASVTSETDYKIEMSGVHTAFISFGSAYNVACTLQISGGAISGGTVFFPSGWTTPNSALTQSIAGSGSGTVTVSSVSGFTANSYYAIDSEAILVTAVNSSTKTLTFTSRAQLGTSQAAHSSGATIRLLFLASQGSGANGSIYSVGGTVTAFTGGSGYTTVGAGSFTNSFNTGITTVNTSGNNVGAFLVQYAKGPVCDAWRLRVPTPSLPHHHVTYYIERWKSGGSLLRYYAEAVQGNGTNDTSNPVYCLTYSADWKNGSTIIRGTTNGTLGWSNQILYDFSSWSTFDSAALGDWSDNDAALKAIEQQRTPAEAANLKASGLTPWLAITPTTQVPTTQTSYESSLNGGIAFYCNYQPMGTAGCRCPAGSGGSGNNENPFGPSCNALYYMARRSGTAGASTWMRNCRVGAAHALGSCQHGAAVYDKNNLMYLCPIPTSQAVYTAPSGVAMTQSATFFSSNLTERGIVHPIIDAKATLLNGAEPYHQAAYAWLAYIIEGHQWALDAFMSAATTVLFGTNPTYRRQATLGSTTYYGVYCAQTSINTRIQAWQQRTAMFACSLHPELWADGSNVIELDAIQQCLKNHYDYLNALVSFTGNVRLGSGGTLVNKTIDFSGTGIVPESFSSTYQPFNEVNVPFMDDYDIQVLAYGSYAFQGTPTGTSIQTYRDYRKNYYVKLLAASGAHYLCDTYRMEALADCVLPATAADSTWAAYAASDVTNPLQGIYTGKTMSFTASSSTITLSGQVIFRGTTRVATGSRIKLTNTSLDNTNNTPGALPPEINRLTWYYYKELTATTCELYTDAGLTTKITPSTSVSGKYFWVVPANTLPADNSGAGTYNGGTTIGGDSRIGVKLGTLRLCKAYGMTDDSNGNVTTAITNAALIFNSLPGQTGYISAQQYGWDSAL